MNTITPTDSINTLSDFIKRTGLELVSYELNTTWGSPHVILNCSVSCRFFCAATQKEFQYTLWLRPDAITQRNLTCLMLFSQVLRDAWKDPAQWVKDSNNIRNIHAYGLLTPNLQLPPSSFLHRLSQFLGSDTTEAFTIGYDLTTMKSIEHQDLSYNRVGEQYWLRQKGR